MWKSSMLKNTTEFFEGDTLLIWCTNMFELLVLIKQLLTYQIYSMSSQNIQDVDTRWDQALLSASKVPKENVLESLYKIRIRESVQLQTA